MTQSSLKGKQPRQNLWHLFLERKKVSVLDNVCVVTIKKLEPNNYFHIPLPFLFTI